MSAIPALRTPLPFSTDNVAVGLEIEGVSRLLPVKLQPPVKVQIRTSKIKRPRKRRRALPVGASISPLGQGKSQPDVLHIKFDDDEEDDFETVELHCIEVTTPAVGVIETKRILFAILPVLKMHMTASPSDHALQVNIGLRDGDRLLPIPAGTLVKMAKLILLLEPVLDLMHHPSRVFPVGSESGPNMCLSSNWTAILRGPLRHLADAAVSSSSDGWRRQLAAAFHLMDGCYKPYDPYTTTALLRDNLCFGHGDSTVNITSFLGWPEEQMPDVHSSRFEFRQPAATFDFFETCDHMDVPVAMFAYASTHGLQEVDNLQHDRRFATPPSAVTADVGAAILHTLLGFPPARATRMVKRYAPERLRVGLLQKRVARRLQSKVAQARGAGATGAPTGHEVVKGHPSS
jgi:hypothetical protein